MDTRSRLVAKSAKFVGRVRGTATKAVRPLGSDGTRVGQNCGCDPMLRCGTPFFCAGPVPYVNTCVHTNFEANSCTWSPSRTVDVSRFRVGRTGGGGRRRRPPGEEAAASRGRRWPPPGEEAAAASRRRRPLRLNPADCSDVDGASGGARRSLEARAAALWALHLCSRRSSAALPRVLRALFEHPAALWRFEVRSKTRPRGGGNIMREIVFSGARLPYGVRALSIL